MAVDFTRQKLIIFAVIFGFLLTTGHHALSAAPGSGANTAYEKALTSFHQEKYEETFIHLKNALKVDPGHIPSRILLAETLIAAGDGAGAEIELEYAREHGADLDRLVALFGRSYILQSKYDRLLETVRSGNRDRVIETEIAFLRGEAYFGQRKLANADRSYAMALELTPDYHIAMLGRAKVASARKQFGKAMEYIDTALESLTPDPNAWIMKSKIYKIRGYNKEAMDAINEALAIDETHLAARLTRAALFIDQRDLEKAEEDVDYILGVIPQEPRAKYLKAIIRAGRGKEEESRTAMSEVVNTLRAVPEEVMNTNPSYYYLAGLTNFQFGNLDEARQYLQDYLKMERDDVSAMRVLGALELQAEDPVAASIVLTEANRAQPNNPTILTLLGISYLEIGNIKKANRFFENVVRIMPESAQSHTNLARGRMAAGSMQEAIQSLIKAEQHNLDSSTVKLLLAQAYQRAGEHDKAIDIIRALKDKAPDNSFINELYATAVGFAGKRDEARKFLEKAITLDPENLNAHIRLARMDVVDGKPDLAIQRITKKMDELPEAYNLMVELGDIYKMTGDGEQALLWYRKAYSLDSSNTITLSKLVEMFEQSGDIEKAISTAEEFTNRFPEDKDIYTMIGNLQMKANNPNKAIKAYELAVEYSINRGAALMTLAKAELAIRDRQGAESSLKKAIAWDPELKEAYIALVQLTIEDKDRLNGLELLKPLRQLTQGAPTADILEGDLHLSAGDTKSAEKAYNAALATGDSPLAILGLFRAYKESNQIRKAITLLETWTNKYPEDLAAAMTLGNAYKLGDLPKKALAQYEALLTRFPGTPAILNNAANLHYDLGNQDLARSYARQALAQAPESVNILDTLAWIETRDGNPETALPLLRKALVLNYSDPEIKYHLAVTLDKLGRRSEARKVLAEALQSDTVFDGRQDARKIFDSWK
ncbi:XrtA/PEP-CTERM system TPR-repeat protein PrsT [Emcibacter sp.]|uniref:XrtA/PEP-CTERM system TPR-repeat protein PrsT n=1 Tax=Emcibacter sp. TaxID=1979954 RepID=UPI002AA94FA8|nr:XrtA/PEP-CTERM system TPR-repeat protein PrsT [Emcibacter sp.]